MNLLEQRQQDGTSFGGQRLHQKQRAAARPPRRDWPSSGAAGGEDAGGGASEERRKNSSRDTCGVRKEVHVAWPARNLICAPAGEGLHHEEQDHGKHDEQNLLRRHGSPAPPQGAGSGNAAMLLSCHVHLVDSCAAAGHARPAAWRAGSPRSTTCL